MNASVITRDLTSHHKHLSNPQLGCKEPRRHENANKKKKAEAEESEKEAEEAEKPREQLREL